LQPTDDGGQISVLGKGGESRCIRLPRQAWNGLTALRQGNPGLADSVFLSFKRGKSLQPLAVHRLVRAAAKRAGIDLPVSPHWLRHAHASHSLDRGAPIHLVQATLGHRNINTTGRYLHARPKESSGRFLIMPD
jgi:site-specific recombinase XerD